MVTASHNENGLDGRERWAPSVLSLSGPDEMTRLKQDLCSRGEGQPRPGGSLVRVSDMRARYLDAVTDVSQALGSGSRWWRLRQRHRRGVSCRTALRRIARGDPLDAGAQTTISRATTPIPKT